MEENFPVQPSLDPTPTPSAPPELTPEILEALKAQARQRAVAQAVETARQVPPSTAFPNQRQVVYVRRNLTVAEILLVFAISCGLVTGVQWTWNVASQMIPKIEIKVR